MNIPDNIDQIDAEAYVEENREKLLVIIRRSDDPFARACAWTLLDRYTPDKSLDELHDELDAIGDREGSK